MEGLKSFLKCDRIFHGCSFTPPSIDDFIFKPIFHIGNIGITKPILLSILSVIIILAILSFLVRKIQIVPGRSQMIAEYLYDFVNNNLSKDTVKSTNLTPFLLALFIFIWFLNMMSIIPGINFPVTARIAFPVMLALIAFVLYIGVGFKRHGLRYFKILLIPSNVPKVLLILLIPIEFFSNVIVRPFTLAIRLFANMFAGHLLLATFSVITWYFVSVSYLVSISVLSFTLSVVLTVFEIFIQALQAYIFVYLLSTYLSAAYSHDDDNH